MDQKRILNQFSAKISKAKILHDTTQAINAKLRKEANQLQKELDQITAQRIKAEDLQKQMKKQADHAQKMKDDQNKKCKHQTYELNQLRNQKKKQQLKKEVNQSDLKKHILRLQQDVQMRQKLQATAKDLSEKLQVTTNQKQALIDQHNKTINSINKYNQRIQSLKTQINQMKDTIRENTVPVHNMVNQVMKSHISGYGLLGNSNGNFSATKTSETS